MNPLISQYKTIVTYLGMVLGPNYEIALHDLTSNENSIVAIVNNHISGRTLGAPLTDMALHFIADKVYENNDFQINYSGVSRDKNKTRSSTMFIKDEDGTLIGMLCINCDTAPYVDVMRNLGSLFGLASDASTNSTQQIPSVTVQITPERVENFAESVPYLVELVLSQTLKDPNIPVERMTQEEKLQIIEVLNSKGVFLLKGAVAEVATALHCSEASIYRYLSTINKKQKYL